MAVSADISRSVHWLVLSGSGMAIPLPEPPTRLELAMVNSGFELTLKVLGSWIGFGLTYFTQSIDGFQFSTNLAQSPISAF